MLGKQKMRNFGRTMDLVSQSNKRRRHYAAQTVHFLTYYGHRLDIQGAVYYQLERLSSEGVLGSKTAYWR